MNVKNVRELIIKSQKGDKESMGELVKLFNPLINRYCYLFGRKDEDLCSEMLIAFIKCVRKFKLDEYAYIQQFALDNPGINLDKNFGKEVKI